MGSRLPSALEDSEIHSLRVGAYPLRSARRVWLPSRRFTPSEPLPVLFRTGSAPGIHPFEALPPDRYPDVSGWKDPPTVQPAVVPNVKTPGRPVRPRLLGFIPAEGSGWQSVGLAPPPSEAPLGFPLLGLPAKALTWLSPGLLSRTLSAKPRMARRPVPQSLDQPSLGSTLATGHPIAVVEQPF